MCQYMEHVHSKKYFDYRYDFSGNILVDRVLDMIVDKIDCLDYEMEHVKAPCNTGFYKAIYRKKQESGLVL
jgi:hypothetical protein